MVENLPDLAILVEPLLIVRRTLREQIVILHHRLLAIVRDDEVCRRLMTTPGVGPVVALTYRATVDVPARFRKSKSVGAVFGLTCAKYQSGEIDRSGRISRCGDEMMRVMLYEAVPHDGQQTAMQDDDLFAERPPDNEQWFDQNGQVGKVLDQLLDARLELGLANHSNLEAEVA